MPTPSITFGPSGLNRVIPQVSAGGRPLPRELARWIDRVVVDTYRHRPDMFEISFLDPDLTVAGSTGLSIGSPVTISSASESSDTETELINGEITAVEGSYGQVYRTVVRGYTKDHRLQRATRSRTFLNVRDSDIARKVAGEYGLPIGTIDASRTAHQHVGQVNQTDWEFLRARADLIGYDVGIVAGRFCFTKPVDVSRGKPVALTFPKSLRVFEPRITAGNLVANTEVRVWDSAARRAVSLVTPTATTSTDLPNTGASELTRPFQRGPAQQSQSDPTLGELGPAENADALALASVPVATGSRIDAAAREVAAGTAEWLGSTVAEAHGEAVGDPRLCAGTTVAISGVGKAFDGRWLITRAVHSYQTDGYATHFEVSGRHERSLLGLAGAGIRATAVQSVPGVVCGVVSNIGDPESLGRIQVILPWLSPAFVTDWAPITHAGAGPSSAALFLPEVGDEVLVAFEFGDPRRPYVLGGLVTSNAKHDLGGNPVLKNGGVSSVVWRGLVSPNGNRLAFHDERTPGSEPTPTKGEIVLGTQRGDIALVIDQVAGTVTLKCQDGGRIDIQTGQGGEINIGGGAQLNLKADASIKIESDGPVEIKGNPIKLN